MEQNYLRQAKKITSLIFIHTRKNIIIIFIKYATEKWFILLLFPYILYNIRENKCHPSKLQGKAYLLLKAHPEYMLILPNLH